MRSPQTLLAALALAAAATGSLGPAAHAAPVISPYAADLAASAYSTSSLYPGTSVAAAFNGEGGYWNAGTWGTHWIQADMGSTQTLSQVVLTIALTPENSTWQNVYLSDSPIGHSWTTLTPVATRSGYTTAWQQFTLGFTATTGRYLQVVSNGGASWTALGDRAARRDWVDPAAGGTPPHGVPEPGSLALVLAGGAAAWALRPGRATRA